MGGDPGTVTAPLGGTPAPLAPAVREKEHPAVVRMAAAKSEAFVAGEDAHGVGGDQGEHRVEGLAAGGSRRERDATARRVQLGDCGRRSGIDVLQHGSRWAPSDEDAAEELVEVLPQRADTREVLVGQARAHRQPDAGEPVAETRGRVEPLDRLAKATPDRCDQVQGQAAGVEAKRADRAGARMTVNGDHCNVLVHYKRRKGE